MKKLSACFLALLLLVGMAGCGGNIGNTDINLIADDTLSPMAVYTMAYNIAESPANYVGKTVQAEGNIVYSEESGTGYFIKIVDNTGCCFQNLEFKLKDGLSYPEDGTLIRITGVFASYITDSGAKALRIDADSIEDMDYLFE